MKNTNLLLIPVMILFFLAGKANAQLNVTSTGKALISHDISLGVDTYSRVFLGDQASFNSLSPGMYIYTLACDGVEIDSKKMILTN